MFLTFFQTIFQGHYEHRKEYHFEFRSRVPFNTPWNVFSFLRSLVAFCPLNGTLVKVERRFSVPYSSVFCLFVVVVPFFSSCKNTLSKSNDCESPGTPVINFYHLLLSEPQQIFRDITHEEKEKERRIFFGYFTFHFVWAFPSSCGGWGSLGLSIIRESKRKFDFCWD